MNLKFNHPSQHSLSQFSGFHKTLLYKNDWKIIDALRMGQQLVVQAHPLAPIFLEKIKNQSESSLILDKLEYLWSIHRYIEKFEPWVVVHQKLLIQQLYDLYTPVYHSENSSEKNKLLVIFDTIYNAFGVSNLVLYAILKAKGYNFLLLKDPSLSCYMQGIKNWGNDLHSVARQITAFAQHYGHQSVRIMGYSSGGYASCYVSTIMNCERFLGFSIISDLSPESVLPINGVFSPEIRKYLHTDEFINLRHSLVRSDDVKRRIVCGALWQDDVLHVENLRGLPNVEIDIMDQTFHDTPLTSIQLGKFDDYLEWLME
jgi:hypothetical protein